MQFSLFDDDKRIYLYPFTYTRPTADIRCGILTIKEKWELLLNGNADFTTTDILQAVFPKNNTQDDICINGRLLPDTEILKAIQSINDNQYLVAEDETILAFKTSQKFSHTDIYHSGLEKINYSQEVKLISYPWDIFANNGQEIENDFELLTQEKNSKSIPQNVQTVHEENIFIEEGAQLENCILNATAGPIYIGKNALIMDGAILRGPIAIGENAVIKMGAKIYGETTIGPGCKVGGEVQNVVFFANSNKGHDGYLGNAVIGEWCNLGADTNCSNLKNDYGKVKVWCEADNQMMDSGLQFCGLLMGDHSKSAINTMFNTGTVVGVSANIFGATFPPQFIPSFSWGGSEKMITYRLKSGIDTANRMMGRRHKQLNEAEEKMMGQIFETTAYQRKK